MSSLQRLVLLPAVIAGLASVSPAQSFETSRTCFRPRPELACDNFVITEVGYYPVIGGSSFVRESPFLGKTGHLESQATYELGFMDNNGASARGVLVSGGVSRNGTRFGVLLRQRRWHPERGTFDFSGGIIRSYLDPSDKASPVPGYGLTGDVQFGWEDFAHVMLRADVVRGGGTTATGFFGGVRLGSYPALIAPVIVFLGCSLVPYGCL